MKLLKELRPAFAVTVVLLFIVSGVYPLLVYGLAQLAFPHQANGSLIYNKEGTLVGSSWLGQNFNGTQYFHSRPSAAGATGYDATSSSGSNFGPTSQKLVDALKPRIELYRKENGLTAAQSVPADAVTASGSGLDPHISVANAMAQLPRVARERKISEDDLKARVLAHTDGRSLGVFGEPAVNVVTLNLELDGHLK